MRCTPLVVLFPARRCAMPDITGWSKNEIQVWERMHQQFATDERADAAADANDPTPEVIAESDRWAKYFTDEAEDA